MFKRIGFFLIINIAMMIMINIVFTLAVNIFGLGPMMYQNGINYTTLAVFSIVWGMGGSFFSLMISRWSAKRFFGVQLVDDRPEYAQLVNKVHQMSKAAGINTMPEVGIYDSPEINAFATGPTKNSSLVAVSTGLLQRMDEDEVDGVLGHEVAHIANGDMVTMALVQGVVNAFVYFLAWIATNIVENFFRGDNDSGRGGLGYFAGYIVRSLFIALFGFLSMPIVAWFSRYREFRADAGSSKLVGKQKMIKALEALKRNYNVLEEVAAHDHRDAKTMSMQISSKNAFMALFSTHPPLDKRISALQNSY